MVERDNTEVGSITDAPPPGRVNALQEADAFILGRYAPAGVIIDADLQVIQFRGTTGPFLELAPGKASLDILKMIREGLRSELRAAIDKAKQTDAPARAEGLRVREGDRLRGVSLEVIPLCQGREGGTSPAAERCFLIVFEEPGKRLAFEVEGAARPAPRTRDPETLSELHIADLEQELAGTKEHLQAIIEEHEATNEELQAVNEEVFASHEELQTLNEELETVKEDLQATNEELTTMNGELEHRNAELNQDINELVSLLASVNLPIVMLGRDLRIQRFTPQAERVLSLRPSDRGRSFGDLRPKVNMPDLERRIAEVIDSASAQEHEVQDREGRWCSMRIQPYLTAKGHVEGAVLCVIDIHNVKQSLDEGVHLQSAGGPRA
jgi:two-component system CheB/CheR fusion protein